MLVITLAAVGMVGCAEATAQRRMRPDPPVPRQVTFTEVAEAAGLAGLGGRAAWADFDNDGHLDLMSGNVLFRNRGDGTFERVQVGAAGPGVWGDVNNDGRLDFYRWEGQGELQIQQPDGTFRADAAFAKNPIQLSESASWADANGDGVLDLYIANYEQPQTPQPNYYVLSNGDGTWRDPVVMPTNTQVWSTRGVAWADFDNDGDQDLYVSNYRLMPNQLYINDGAGNLTDEAWPRGAAGDGRPELGESEDYIYTGHTIGSVWGDLNGDGYLDLVVVNFSHPPAFQNRVQVLINSGPPHYTFTDINKDAAAGIYWQESYAKGALGDFDNDGDLDLYITTVYSGDTGDLFLNDGTGRFTPAGDDYAVRLKDTYTVTWADYDDDGFLDLQVGDKLFRNSGNENGWLKVKVVGNAGSNGAAIGARVRVTVGGRRQIREVSGGDSGNQQPLTVLFGLAQHRGPVRVEVWFPSGKYGSWTVSPRQTFTARESDRRVRRRGPGK